VSAEDPIRFRDAGSGSDELRALFQAGTEDLPTEAQLASLASKLGPVLTAGGAAASAGMAMKTKLGMAAVGAAGAGVLAWALLSGREAPAPVKPAATAVQSRTAPAVTPSGGSELPTATAPEAAPAPSGAPPSSETAPSTARPAVAPPFRPAESEAEFLERARGALGQSPAAALSLANQHRARFPAGVLAEEREVIAIEALKRLGRTAEAERRIEAFARRFPGSAYRKKLEAGAGR
jgi:hypothetical protein